MHPYMLGLMAREHQQDLLRAAEERRRARPPVVRKAHAPARVPPPGLRSWQLAVRRLLAF